MLYIPYKWESKRNCKVIFKVCWIFFSAVESKYSKSVLKVP